VAATVEAPVKLFKNQKAWEDWLEKHADSSTGLWLRIAKKSSKLKSISHQEALDTALCHGWIDALRKTLDDDSFIQRFTPRTKKSLWSKINRDKALSLIKSGRMRPGGVAAIEAAKGDGRWQAAYDSHRTSTVPQDLQEELDRNPKAKAFFATLNSQNRYAVLFRIQTAAKSETRKKRIAQFVEMLEQHRKLHP
jgi:uncharacterized protein YdeI (YjbR/CyaY-like superfamily)